MARIGMWNASHRHHLLAAEAAEVVAAEAAVEVVAVVAEAVVVTMSRLARPSTGRLLNMRQCLPSSRPISRSQRQM